MRELRESREEVNTSQNLWDEGTSHRITEQNKFINAEFNLFRAEFIKKINSIPFWLVF